MRTKRKGLSDKQKQTLRKKALQIRTTASKEFGITLFTPQALRFARISLRAEHNIRQRSNRRGIETCK